jgi:hypothetical protein
MRMTSKETHRERKDFSKSRSSLYAVMKSSKSTQVRDKKQSTDSDCTEHSMYIKAQALIEIERQKVSDLEKRIEALDAVIFKSADKVETPPELFQVSVNADLMKEYFYKDLSPIQAIAKLRQILNSVQKIDIGWRVLEP